jgi:Flp pilus assembly protein TadD
MPQIHFQLGMTLAALDNVSEAVRHFQEALRLNPRYAAAAEQLKKLQAGP